MNSFTKQPSEIFPVSIDYLELLNTGETITSLTVTAVDQAGTSATSTVILSSSISSTICTAIVKGGTSRTNYKITFKASTNLGNLYEEDVTMKVIET